MDSSSWGFIFIVTLCISALLKSLFDLLSSESQKKDKESQFLPLPPGPPAVPLIGNFLWLRKSFSELEPTLRKLKAEYGPLIALKMGHRLAIFVASHSLAHRALVQDGAIFCDRPKALPATKIFNNQRNISSAPYGGTWRLLRRNLTSEILHPSRIKSYSAARRWVLGILLRSFLAKLNQVDLVTVNVVEDFRYAMFCLLVLMCFGDKLQAKQIQEIETATRRVLLSFDRLNALNFWPRLGKILFRNRWKQLLQLRQDQEKVLIPLIRARIESKQRRHQDNQEDVVVAYADTLLGLELPDEKRKLNEGEMVSLCSEFLNAGTDSTSTALQWIMANLVKYPAIQDKLYHEIREVVGPAPPLTFDGGHEKEVEVKVIEEEDLQRMPYLKAVVLEGLRRHPPGHFVLPHSVTKDVVLDGYVVPKNATVNFMVAEMGCDPEVWEDPMEFKPERFLEMDRAGEAFDITGSREIKMMPFGAGRRLCPGLGLALLHLECFVANLIWYYRWRASDGDDVDLSEKQEFTVVMKNPLSAQICLRF